MRLCCVILLSLSCCCLAQIRQMVLSVAPDWDSTRGKLQRFEQVSGQWKRAGAPIPVLYGRNGLAWGRGLRSDTSGLQKTERDKRAPAGLFEIGKIYTSDAKLPEGANYPFLQVGAADAWVDDVALPFYNQHVRVDPKNPPVWFEKQRMRQNDPAYRWRVEIRHNADPPVSGAGSAIFFHIRRGPTRPSAGCTTMAEEDLMRLICWLRADARPVYALLTAEEYRRRWKQWGLPSPDLAAPLLAE